MCCWASRASSPGFPFCRAAESLGAHTRRCTRACVTATHPRPQPDFSSGLFPAIVDVPMSLAAGSVLGRTTRVHLAIWHGFSPVLLLSILTLAGVAALYRWREQLRGREYGHGHSNLNGCTPGRSASLDAVSAWSSARPAKRFFAILRTGADIDGGVADHRERSFGTGCRRCRS